MHCAVLTAEIGWVLVLREKPGCSGWIFPVAGSNVFSIKVLPESHVIYHLDPSALQVVCLQVTAGFFPSQFAPIQVLLVKLL